MRGDLVSVGKFLSLILRHQPEVIGVQIDPEGWLAIDELIESATRHGHSLTLEKVHEVVATNDKKRFALSEDGLRIRASQGHSIPGIELNLERQTPPEFLFHGTVADFLPSIREQGLLKRSRNHVHLSASLETARKVGARRGTPIVLTIAASQMYLANYAFYLSQNGVWLTHSVPPSFIAYP